MRGDEAGGGLSPAVGEAIREACAPLQRALRSKAEIAELARVEAVAKAIGGLSGSGGGSSGGSGGRGGNSMAIVEALSQLAGQDARLNAVASEVSAPVATTLPAPLDPHTTPRHSPAAFCASVTPCPLANPL